MILIGEHLPALSLLDEEGNAFDLERLKGGISVLYFYPRDLTPGCSLEAQTFQKGLPRFQELGVNVFGISSDAPARHIKFKEKYGLEFALLSDPEKLVIQAFDLLREKNMYGKKVLGVLRSTFIVDQEGKLIYAEYGSKPTSASENALKFLSTLI